MKKAISVLICLLFLLTMLYPVGSLTASLFGYDFELISVLAFAIAIALLSLCIVVLDLVSKNTYESQGLGVLLSFLTPLSFINAIFYISECPQAWVIASVLFSGCCCFYLTVKYGKSFILKIAALVLSALMVLPICFFSFIALVFGDFVQNTVVQPVESPSGKYYAQVIDSDQGALGGDTLIDVYENSGIDAVLFKVKKHPQRVYHGDWGVYKNLQIYWKDDTYLVIGSVEHEIK